MSTVGGQKRYSIQEYLSFEKDSLERHEYYAGEIFALSGGSLDHGAIAFNWCGELKAALKGKNCRAFTSDVKVRIEAEDAFVYPDVEVFRRTDDVWKVYDHYHGLEVNVYLTTLDVVISMEEIYSSISFGE